MDSPFILRPVARAAPPGFPPDVAPNQIIHASHINAIRDSVAVWPGNVDGNGKILANVAQVAASSSINAPDLYATNSITASVYRSTAAMVFSVGAGVPERMRITAAGVVGIGTASPNSNVSLEVFKAGATQLQAIFGHSAAAVGILSFSNVPAIQGYNGTAAAGSADLALQPSSGNVGIGTASPLSILDVSRAAPAGRTNITFTNPAAPDLSDRIRLRLGPSSGFVGSDIHPYCEAYCENASTQSAGLAFGTYAGTLIERMRITAAGNVGIGTDIPDVPFVVKGAPNTSFGIVKIMGLGNNVGISLIGGGVMANWQITSNYSAAGNLDFLVSATPTSDPTQSRFQILSNGGIVAPLLPSANPGAGSKQFWYDPADSNRVKYAA